MNYATVQREGFVVPLIGVARDAILQECDLCHDPFPLTMVRFNGVQFLCEKCDSELVRTTQAHVFLL